MNGHFILKRDHPQVSPFEFRDLRPEPVPVAFLRFRPERIVQHARAPLLLQLRAFPQNLFLEVLGEAVLGHVQKDTASIGAGTCCRLTSAVKCAGEQRSESVIFDRTVRRRYLW